MRNYVAKDVDTYIGSADPQAQPHLKQLRRVIKSAVSDVEEGISWGIPFYLYHGLIAGFSPFKHHVSFGFAATLQTNDRKTLEENGYKTGSKTIQIRFDQKVPVAKITHIVQSQAKTNIEKAKN